MARRSKPNDTPEALQQHLIDLLTNFSEELKNEDLRAKVVALVPAFHTLRDLGSSLIPKTEAPSARDRIIAYLKQYPLTVIDGDELINRPECVFLHFFCNFTLIKDDARICIITFKH